MPLITYEYPQIDTCLGLWRVDESIEEFLQSADFGYDREEFLRLKSEKRKIQWLASRFLVYHLMKISKWELSHVLKDIENKPYTANPPYFVSISHSYNMVVALISKRYAVGVDIEKFDRDFQMVKLKYLNAKEQSYAQQDNEKACLYWTAKEAVYKVVGKPVYNFKETVVLHAPEDEAIKAHIVPLDMEMNIQYRKWENFYISFIVNC